MGFGNLNDGRAQMVKCAAGKDIRVTPMRIRRAQHMFGLMLLVLCLGRGYAELRVSRVNPRYFVQISDTTRAVFLAGSHTWLNNRDGGEAPDIAHVPVFNWQGFLNFLSDQHHNFVKYWCWEADWNNALSSVTDFRYGPYSPYIRNGATNAEDGAPKFNLNSFNQSYFDRVKARIDTLGGRGVYADVMLFNGWAVENKASGQNPFRGHPYNSSNNVQGVGFTDANGANTQRLPGQGGSSTILAYQVAYVKKMIDELNFRDNIMWEICNEPNSNAQGWQYAIIDTIRNYERTKPKQHPILMSIEWPGGDPAEELDPTKHNTAASTSADYSSQVDDDTVKVIISDTDHICGECNDGTWAYKSFCNGVGSLLYMDPWDGRDYPHMASNYDSAGFSWVSARKALGQIQQLANYLNVIDMRPTPALASTGYCLSGNSKWIVYRPGSGSFTVNLSSTTDSLNVRWLNINDGSVQTGTKIVGGQTGRLFTPPSGNHDILYLFADIQPPSVPAAPLLALPPNGTVGVVTAPTLTWSGSAGATVYRLQVATDPGFGSTVLDDSTITGTLRQVPGLTTSTLYYWHVSAANTAGSGPWSQDWQFTTTNLTTVQIPLIDRWNLISVPLTVNDPRTSVLFPTAISRAFRFVSGVGYLPGDTLLNGNGYWLKFDTAQNVGVTGLVRPLDTVAVQSGWNIIGSISMPVDTSMVLSIPPGIRVSSFFEYLSGYTPAASISPGKGYWVKTSAAGHLILPAVVSYVRAGRNQAGIPSIQQK